MINSIPFITMLAQIGNWFVFFKRSISRFFKFPVENTQPDNPEKSLPQAYSSLRNTPDTPEKVEQQAMRYEVSQRIADFLVDILAHSQIKVQELEVENFFVTQAGIEVFYHCVENDQVQVYIHLLETAQPNHALWPRPKLITTIGPITEQWQFQQLTKTGNENLAIWYSPHFGVKEICYPQYLVKSQIRLRHQTHVLFKPSSNPILKPNSQNSWEAFCTFNPAAVYVADQVHLLYRAQGYDYVSQIGYASSSDGYNINYRASKPIYKPREAFEGVAMPPGDPNNSFVSGGGCGGCEDPRATVIDDRVYLTYVAFDGWNPPRIALSSIALTDFLNHKFLWEKPVLISKPGVVDKSAVIFPEKVNGKYVVMHRVFPDIQLDYVDSLNFDGQTYLQGEHKISPRSREWWDSRKIGAGAPPLKTEEGWLLIYQAVDDKDASQYKVGAMLLDLDEPTKVLYRSAQPILEPIEEYENFGFKAGVVYPCGAVIKDNTLFVYYGGADSFVCVATAPLEQFLTNLKKTGVAHLGPSLLGLTNS